nr:hypothetical protein [Tanacetum cinerariifolium]
MIPVLIGLLFELLVIVPMRVPVDESPVFLLYQDWALGLIFLKIWTRLVMMDHVLPLVDDSWRVKFERQQSQQLQQQSQQQIEQNTKILEALNIREQPKHDHKVYGSSSDEDEEGGHVDPANQQRNCIPRIKAGIPTFSGSLNIEDFIDWVSKTEKYFELMDIPEDSQVKYVAYKLRGPASSWLMLTTLKKSEDNQRHNIFRTRCRINQDVVNVIIDGGSSKVRVTKQCEVPISMGKYKDTVLFNIVDMDACHILLGRPWQFDLGVIHKGKENTCMFSKDGKKFTLCPLFSEDQLKATKEKAITILLCSREAFLAEVRHAQAIFIVVVKGDNMIIKNVPPKLHDLLSEFMNIMPEELPDGLPPLRDIQHQIDFVPRDSLLNLPYYHMSPSEHDISNTEDEQLDHIREVLKVLQEHQLFVNLKKCSFVTHKLLFLGFVVSADAPVLILPNFQKPFELENDAPIIGVEAVLTQEWRPIAFFSEKLSEARRKWTTYELEFYAIHKAGTKNKVADALSRRATLLITMGTEGISFDCLKDLYASDDDLSEVWKQNETDFMIVEDIISIIDPRLSQVVLEKPFIDISNMTHDPTEGVARFINGTNEIAYKMPHKIEQYNSLSDLEKEHTKSVYLRNAKDKRKGVIFDEKKLGSSQKVSLNDSWRMI